MYAAAGVPRYWIVDVDRPTASTVWTGDPGQAGQCRIRCFDAARFTTYRSGQSIPVVIDGQHSGEVPVADIFPPETKSGPAFSEVVS